MLLQLTGSMPNQTCFFTITDMLVALVLLATGHRLPNALPVMRWIWSHGKHLLISSYILGVCIFLYLNYTLIQNHDSNNIIIAATAIIPNIIIATVIFRSKLMKDIFNDFPPPRIEK